MVEMRSGDRKPLPRPAPARPRAIGHPLKCPKKKARPLPIALCGYGKRSGFWQVGSSCCAALMSSGRATHGAAGCRRPVKDLQSAGFPDSVAARATPVNPGGGGIPRNGCIELSYRTEDFWKELRNERAAQNGSALLAAECRNPSCTLQLLAIFFSSPTLCRGC